jgi:rubrerythrin
MKRDFTSLTPQEGLHVAIFIEERNALLYRQFAELFGDFPEPDAREITSTFLNMADEEFEHCTLLQELYEERYGTAPCAITDEDISDLIELPRLEDGNIFAIARASASPLPRNQALRVALKAEEAAFRYYARLVKITKEKELRSFYMELAQFESGHTEFLRHRLKAESYTPNEA